MIAFVEIYVNIKLQQLSFTWTGTGTLFDEFNQILVLRHIMYSFYQEKNLDVEINTSFEDFTKWLMNDKQTFSLDAGNIKLTYNSVSSRFVWGRWTERQTNTDLVELNGY